jgi:signal peptidase II
MKSSIRFGLIIAVITFVIDQVTKHYIVDHLFRSEGVTQTPYFTRELVEILPFFQLRLIWNAGISFSLFNSGEATTIAILVVFQLAIVGVLLWWLRQAETRMIGVGIGFIVGGALGNIVDRINYGAVVDFLDFHLVGYHFPTFNVADSCITIGVVFWLLDAFLTRHHHSPTHNPE